MRMVNWGRTISFDDQNAPQSPDSGGLQSALAAEVVENIMADNERVRAAFRTPRGLTQISEDSARRTAQTAVMVVTDRRVLFTADPKQSTISSGHSYSVPYAEIGSVSIGGDERDVLVLSTTEGERWEFRLPETDPETVDAVIRHLQWVGEIRGRVVAGRNDVELAAGEIREHAAAMEWEAAAEVYETLRQQMDQLILAVQWTEPIADQDIAPELTAMERTLERAYAELFIERGHSQLELATQLVDNEDYDQAGPVLQSARESHGRAQDRLEVITRGDAFQFGEQRELRDELDRLGWEIETVAAEPLRQAHEARIRASDATDTPTAVERLETAFRRYGTVLTIARRDDTPAFAGDGKDARENMTTVGSRLVSGHRELAHGKWDEGIEAEQAGRVKDAIRACQRAIDHLERAEELASGFQPDEVGDIAEHRARIEQAVTGLRERAPADHADTNRDADGEREPNVADEANDGQSLSSTGQTMDLLDMDTHHEITLDATLDDKRADERRGQRENGSDAPKRSDVPILDALADADSEGE